MPFPAIAKVEMLNQKHPEYKEHEAAWRLLDVLYRGGDAIRTNAPELLVKRPKEPEEVFSARCSQVTYTDLLSQGIGWYISSMFSQTPTFSASKDGETLEKVDQFYSEFETNCDRAGLKLVNFWKYICEQLILNGRAAVLVDLPGTIEASNRADEKAQAKPYLVAYSASDVLNWSIDEAGNLEWIMLQVSRVETAEAFPHAQQTVTWWYYFDRQNFAQYRWVENNKQQKMASLVAEGAHGFAAEGRVPVRLFVMPHGLWLGNRAMLPALNHLNRENEYDWQLKMASLPVPYVSGQRMDEGQMVSEHAWLQLGQNSQVGYLEPSGVSFQANADRIRVIREDLMRQLYLLAQARDTGATPAAQSGVSKEADMTPSYEVCGELGDRLREWMEDVQADVVKLRGDEDKLQFTVKGFQFEESDVLGELTTIERVKSLGIQSDTLDLELDVQAAGLAMPDADERLRKTIEHEIRSGPTRSEREEAKKEEMMQQFASGVRAA